MPTQTQCRPMRQEKLTISNHLPSLPKFYFCFLSFCLYLSIVLVVHLVEYIFGLRYASFTEGIQYHIILQTSRESHTIHYCPVHSISVFMRKQ